MLLQIRDVLRDVLRSARRFLRVHRRPQFSPRRRRRRHSTRTLRLPRLAPSFTPHPFPRPHLRALLFALNSSLGGSWSALTADDLAVVLDSGCSIAITPRAEDFIDGTYHVRNAQVTGIADGLSAAGIGEVLWPLTDIDGSRVDLRFGRQSAYQCCERRNSHTYRRRWSSRN